MKNLKFLNHSKFPANAPPDHIRIVDTDLINDRTIFTSASALDAAMTLLYNFDPKILDKFFDPAKLGAQFTKKKGDMDTLKIERSKNSIWVGYGNNQNIWKERVDYMGDDQGCTWKIDGAVETFEVVDKDGRRKSNLVDGSKYDEASARLAKWIYDTKAWNTVAGDEVTFTVADRNAPEKVFEELVFHRVY